MKNVTVEVTDRDAIYIDGTRITNRSTKWGTHLNLVTWFIPKDRVIDTLIEHGFTRSVRLIDFEPYATLARAALETKP
jgi:hypothetical protein